MPRQRILVSTLVYLLSACSSEHKLEQGTTMTGEAPRETADATVNPETESTNIPEVENLPEPEVASETANQPSPPPPAESPAPEEWDREDEENNKRAMEPVPIGGAYLICGYQKGQMQGSEDYLMDCAVESPKDVKAAIVSAEFHKVDAQGNRTVLKVLNEDLMGLQWTIQEPVSAMNSSEVQVILSAIGFLPTTLNFKISSSINMTQNPDFWLGGEPNNLVLAGEDEDCVQFVTASVKLSHQEFSGATSGPLGRLNDIACSTRYSFLCRNVSAGDKAPKWVVSGMMGAFSESAGACSPGYAFGLPLNSTEMAEVSLLVDQENRNVWVNMNDLMKEGLFTAILH